MERLKTLATVVTMVALTVSFASMTPAFAQDKKDEPVAAPAATPPPAETPATPPPAAAPAAPMVQSIKILFDDKAKNDGKLVFTFTPEGGAAKTISVTIAAKMDRKDVAKSAATELDVALGDGYKVDKYDPDKIKISAKGKAKFSLTISSLTANGLSVRLL